jgi:hypothetical protein
LSTSSFQPGFLTERLARGRMRDRHRARILAVEILRHEGKIDLRQRHRDTEKEGEGGREEWREVREFSAGMGSGGLLQGIYGR